MVQILSFLSLNIADPGIALHLWSFEISAETLTFS